MVVTTDPAGREPLQGLELFVRNHAVWEKSVEGHLKYVYSIQLHYIMHNIILSSLDSRCLSMRSKTTIVTAAIYHVCCIV